MKHSEHSETLLKGRRRTGVYSDATGANRMQTVDKHWSEIMPNALSYDFWRKELFLMIFKNWHSAAFMC